MQEKYSNQRRAADLVLQVTFVLLEAQVLFKTNAAV
jgi:hypothetical protein